MDISKVKTVVMQLSAKREVLTDKLTADKIKKIELEKRIKAVTEAQVLIQKTAVETQQLIKIHLEDIVNKVLQTCFPEYSFKMDYTIKYNKAVCNLQFYKGANETDLLDGDSGGALNTACVSLRLAVWTISASDNCLILDEAFANLSQNLQPLMGEILSELSRQLHLQIILISHSPSIDAWADKIYTVYMENGVSRVL
jgi:DNA repair ATPase RecN